MKTKTSLAHPKPYSVSDFRFWKAYWIHMRPYLLFISGIAGFAGIVLSEGFVPFSLSSFIAFLPLFLGYGFGQALTDAFQTDTDSLSAAYRPLSQKLIRPKDVLIVSLIGLIGCSVVLAYFNVINLLWGAISVVGLASYSYFKKHFWYLGPACNATVVSLLPLMGYCCFSSNLTISQDLMVLIAVNFLAYTNFVIIGYLKDISADRATGYQTLPVVWGWKVTTLVGDVVVAAVSLCFFIFWYDPLGSQTFGFLAFIIATGIAVYGQFTAHRIEPKVEENATIPVISTVRSFLWWNGSAILLFSSEMLVPFIVFYALFELTLAQRPMAHQI